MKLAQHYLKETTSEEITGGFNARLQGETFLMCMDGMPAGSRWGQRSNGWKIANKLIKEGKIFSEVRTDKGVIEFKCAPDGRSWCCVGAGFINLQESDNYAFGASREEAIIRFITLVDI